MPGYKRRRPGFKRRRTYAKRPARKTRVRRGRVRRRVFRRSGLPKRMGNVIPRRIFTKFHAVDTWIPTAAAGGVVTNFYANNPYDPVVGISTTDCSGFEAMMGIYQYGICYACKISAKIMNTSASAIAFIKFLPSTTALPVAVPNYNAVTEIGQDIRWRHIPVFQYNQLPTRMKYYRTIKSLERKRELEPNDYKFTGTVGPSKAVGVAIGGIPAKSDDATAITLQLFLKITYYCKLYELKDSAMQQ